MSSLLRGISVQGLPLAASIIHWDHFPITTYSLVFGELFPLYVGLFVTVILGEGLFISPLYHCHCADSSKVCQTLRLF